MQKQLENQSEVAIYGNTCIERVYCGACKCFTFVIENTKQCCNEKIETEVKTVKRECETVFRRRNLTQEEKDQILSDQDYRCFYCGRVIGSLMFRKHRAIRLRAEFDHVVPFVFNANNDLPNMVATCHICNRHKGSKMFNTLEDAQIFLINRMSEKGYTE